MFACILALLRHGKRYTSSTDVCHCQIECALLQQKRNGDKLLVGYWSRNLSAPEKNYSATGMGCFAVMWSIVSLRSYLHGDNFTLCTDYHALKWILNLVDSSGWLVCWRLRLTEHDYKVEHLPENRHKVADGVSRLRRSEEKTRRN